MQSSAQTTSRQTLSVQDAMQGKLQDTFRPIHLQILNESHKHNV